MKTLASCVLFLFICGENFAKSSQSEFLSIKNLFQDYLKNSELAHSLSSESIIDHYQNQSIYNNFETQLSLDNSAKLTQHSRDSNLSKSRDLNSKLSISKTFSDGISLSGNYLTQNLHEEFRSGSNDHRFISELSLTVESQIIQEIFGNKSHLFLKYLREQKKYKEYFLNNEILRNFRSGIEKLVTYLLSQRLANENKKQCLVLTRQRKNFARLSREGVRSKKDYLRSQISESTCYDQLAQLEQSIRQNRREIKNLYFSQIDFNSVESNFRSLAIEFEKQSNQLLNKEFPESALIKMFKAELKKENTLLAIKKAEAMLPLNVGLSVGAESTTKNYLDSQKKVLQFDNPFIQLQVDLKFPIGNKKKSEKIAQKYRIISFEKKLERETKLDQLRKTNLIDQISVLKKRSRRKKLEVSLSKEILDNSHKDFSRGKIGSFQLADDQKKYLEAVQNLFRAQFDLIALYIEHLHSHNHFDQYMKESNVNF